LESLEPQTTELDLSRAREFPGWSDMKASGGKLFVSSGEEPSVTRYAVNERLELVEEARISFAEYGADASMYSQVFISETKAYLALGAGKYVVWNPTEMLITKTITGPAFAPTSGADAAAALDRGMVVRGDRLFHSVNWFDYTNYRMSPSSSIVVLDTTTDEVTSVLDAGCPYLEPGTLDEAGNLYFSNWVYSPAATLMNDQARACAVRIPAGQETLDLSWQLEFSAVTAGHEAAAMEYLGGGQALLSVFHEDNQAFDPQVDDVFDWVFGANWRFSLIDLDTRETRELDTVGWHSGGYYAARIDDMTYVLVPGDGYDSTVLYRLSARGDTTRVFDMKGWSTRLVRLR
jgi:hypothetical protein